MTLSEPNDSKIIEIAEVAELADALRSGRSGHYVHVGSTPSFGKSYLNFVFLQTFTRLKMFQHKIKREIFPARNPLS